jgi:hypothetical protein
MTEQIVSETIEKITGSPTYAEWTTVTVSPATGDVVLPLLLVCCLMAAIAMIIYLADGKAKRRR